LTSTNVYRIIRADLLLVLITHELGNRDIRTASTLAVFQQKAELSQRGRAMLRVVEYFAKLLKSH